MNTPRQPPTPSFGGSSGWGGGNQLNLQQMLAQIIQNKGGWDPNVWGGGGPYMGDMNQQHMQQPPPLQAVQPTSPQGTNLNAPNPGPWAAMSNMNTR